MVRNDLLLLSKVLLGSRLVSCPLRTFIVLHGFTSFFIDFHGLRRFHRFSCISEHGCLILGATVKGGLAWLASCLLKTFIVFHTFSYIFMNFQWFGGHGCLKPGTTVKGGTAAHLETFARFQAGFLSSEDFRRISWIFIDFYQFLLFSQPSADCHWFRGMGA